MPCGQTLQPLWSAACWCCSDRELHARDRLANGSSCRTPPICAVQLSAAFGRRSQPALQRLARAAQASDRCTQPHQSISSQHRSAALTWGPSRPESAGHGHGRAAWTAPSARATARACCAGQTRPQSAGTTGGDGRATSGDSAGNGRLCGAAQLLHAGEAGRSSSGRLLRHAAHAAAFQSWRARRGCAGCGSQQLAPTWLGEQCTTPAAAAATQQQSACRHCCHAVAIAVAPPRQGLLPQWAGPFLSSSAAALSAPSRSRQPLCCHSCGSRLPSQAPLGICARKSLPAASASRTSPRVAPPPRTFSSASSRSFSNGRRGFLKVLP